MNDEEPLNHSCLFGQLIPSDRLPVVPKAKGILDFGQECLVDIKNLKVRLDVQQIMLKIADRVQKLLELRRIIIRVYACLNIYSLDSIHQNLSQECRLIGSLLKPFLQKHFEIFIN